MTPGSAGNDVWAVGDRGTILHWDGSAWTKVPSNTTAHLFGVAMVSASRGWAAGSDGAIVEWNGSAWNVVPPKSSDWYRAVAIVPGTQPVQAWAPGDKAGVGFFLYYDGAEWKTKIGDYTPIFGGTLFDVSMLSAGAGWAVGNKFGGTGMVGQTLRWDGARWNTFSNPADELYAVHMLSASDGWSVGEAGAAYRWNGAAWSKVPTPRTELLNDVHMVAASDGWAVGEAGAILRWNGSAWTDYTAASISQDLRGVAMISAADGWAVGDGGVILRWNGSAWRTVVAPAYTRLESLAMTPGMSGGDGWAVGERPQPPALGREQLDAGRRPDQQLLRGRNGRASRTAGSRVPAADSTVSTARPGPRRPESSPPSIWPCFPPATVGRWGGALSSIGMAPRGPRSARRPAAPCTGWMPWLPMTSGRPAMAGRLCATTASRGRVCPRPTRPG